MVNIVNLLLLQIPLLQLSTAMRDMERNQVILAPTVRNSVTTATTKTDSDNQVVTPENGKGKEPTSLRITDSLICNDKECYPRVFEPEDQWKPIRPEQQLPGGLDIRMNLDTGLKEAKLLPIEERNVKTFAKVDKEEKEVEKEKSDVGSPKEQIIERKEKQEQKQSTIAQDSVTEYEFSNDFKTIRDLLYNPTILSKDLDNLETIFDNVMEFAHDYKHGYKIISHEFRLLQNISFNDQLPPTIRELSTRVITSCLRNNPPVKEYINNNYPAFIDNTFVAMDILVNNLSYDLKIKKFLLKRYLSILNELIETPYQFTKDKMIILQHIYAIQDQQIKIKILELISICFTDEIDSNENEELPNLNKRDNIQQNVPDLQSWTNEFTSLVQDKDLDEWHLRKFFNSLYNIKTTFKKDIKIDSKFLNWLAEQEKQRTKRLNNGLQERDLEQDSFDEKLISSRHSIFGNPLADRIKHFDDEL
ncbi:Sil1p NDAI_0A08490 [Naumovozyma dairenensis CBS 421]|uniref:Nucleotide exchange factor SIL1 n=1 Tax=Naumovozyma dairenensis (strain ATCC 10597 / BCRC 20456 / CBS 421 / NBRC 0211 / NRRL Y-12639) TaxID=1071378 RepID=G0W5B4_NAUDC|nr:hypothetical protein NDAI_0A08490 [Naumovozyma dairenensis CBS 421]CCD23002.1 hypothetical protein NDAI_0A08490 [Naumovozyma dairenensis CBS 421]